MYHMHRFTEAIGYNYYQSSIYPSPYDSTSSLKIQDELVIYY
jgi:hypothetical protein